MTKRELCSQISFPFRGLRGCRYREKTMREKEKEENKRKGHSGLAKFSQKFGCHLILLMSWPGERIRERDTRQG
jgi:hypothetical protein